MYYHFNRKLKGTIFRTSKSEPLVGIYTWSWNGNRASMRTGCINKPYRGLGLAGTCFIPTTLLAWGWGAYRLGKMTFPVFSWREVIYHDWKIVKPHLGVCVFFLPVWQLRLAHLTFCFRKAIFLLVMVIIKGGYNHVQIGINPSRKRLPWGFWQGGGPKKLR